MTGSYWDKKRQAWCKNLKRCGNDNFIYLSLTFFFFSIILNLSKKKKQYSFLFVFSSCNAVIPVFDEERLRDEQLLKSDGGGGEKKN